MKLHDLRPPTGSRTARTRVGRGIAAGKGKTAGRGTKGQKARAGGSIPPWFEGGQTPLHMRIPKLRGFKNRCQIEYEVVNVGGIARARRARRVRAASAGRARPKKAERADHDQPGHPARGRASSATPEQAAQDPRRRRARRRPLFVVADAFTASRPRRRSRRPAAPSASSRSRPDRGRPSASTTRAPPDAGAPPTGRAARPPRPSRPKAAPAAEAAAPEAAEPRTRLGRRRSAARGRRRAEPSRHEPARPTSRRRPSRRRRRPTSAPSPGGRTAPTTPDDADRRRRLTRVRFAAERLPRAGHPAPDPLRPGDPGHLPVPGRTCRCRASTAGPAGEFLAGQPAVRRCWICSRAAACRTSRSSALGVNPYINASIIMQLMTGVVPVAPGAEREGEYGRNKINQYTRYLTVPMALLQAYGFLALLNSQADPDRPASTWPASTR